MNCNLNKYPQLLRLEYHVSQALYKKKETEKCLQLNCFRRGYESGESRASNQALVNNQWDTLVTWGPKACYLLNLLARGQKLRGGVPLKHHLLQSRTRTSVCHCPLAKQNKKKGGSKKEESICPVCPMQA